MSETHTPPWASEMQEGDFISYAPSYVGGKYVDLFKLYMKPSEKTGDIRYYVYDPTEHGYAKDKKYPLLVWLHGAGSSMVGIECITHSGGETYASPEYQEKMGGAYILVPLANESIDENGKYKGVWSEDYIAPLLQIVEEYSEAHKENIGKRFLLGSSAGGMMTWGLAMTKAELFAGIMPMCAPVLASDEDLDRIAATGAKLAVIGGKRDEFFNYEEQIAPRVPKLKSFPGWIVYYPEWVRNGNHGIASIFYRDVEMGQHCINNSVQENLIYDDGTCMSEQFPEGVTGWINSLK